MINSIKSFLWPLCSITSIVIISSCTSGGGSDSPADQNNREPVNNSTNLPKPVAGNNINNFATYNFYIDNSGSMSGFTPKKNPTEFQNCMANFIQNLFNPATCSYKFYTFNSSIHFISIANNSKEVYMFTSDLLTGNIKAGDTHSTIFDYNAIINSQNKDNIILLISDFIPSKKDASSALLPGEIKNLVKSKLALFGFSTLFLKFHSRSEKVVKPYYVMLMGDEKKVKDILLYIQKNNYSNNGYDAFYILSNPEKPISTKLNFSQENLYDADYNNHGVDLLRTINAHSGKNDSFKISFRINLDSIPFSSNYLLDSSNYAANTFKVRVELLRDNKEGFTHNVILTSRGCNKSDVFFNLRNQSLQQFTLANADCDIPVLVGAFTDAYKERFPKMAISNANGNNYLTKTITIK